MQVLGVLGAWFILMLAILGTIVALGLMQISAYGSEIALFAEAPECPVCLFSEAPESQVCLFNPFVEHDSHFALFADLPDADKPAEDPENAEVFNDDQVVLGPPVGMPIAKAAPAKPDTRPVVYVYGPDWCGVCPGLFKHLGNGDSRIRVICIKGKMETFPADVQKKGNDGTWPVAHWNSPKGKGAVDYVTGTTTLSELFDLSKCEPGQTRASKPMKSSPTDSTTMIASPK